eukprot:gene2134-2327_t
MIEEASGVLILVGIVVAAYAIYIEVETSSESDYEALCDISQEISCTKVLESDYSRMISFLGIVPKNSVLDQSNAVYGLLFYILEGFVYLLWRKSRWGQLSLLWMSALTMTILNTLIFICFSIAYFPSLTVNTESAGSERPNKERME